MRMNRAAGSDDELLAETASRGLGGGGAAALRYPLKVATPCPPLEKNGDFSKFSDASDISSVS